MKQYIDKSDIKTEIEKLRMNHGCVFNEYDMGFSEGRCSAFDEVLSFLDTLETKEIDLKKESELIANGIMIGVQGNKYHTCMYNPERCDFNHSHLWLAARKGIEFGLNAQKGE